MNIRRKRVKVLYFIIACAFAAVYYFVGVGDYIYTKDFDENFDYPLNIDLKPILKEVLAGREPPVKPINVYPYRFLTNTAKCKTFDRIDLFIAVKSAMSNFGHRTAVRNTWGQENQMPGKVIKIMFFLGVNESPHSDVQKQINEEMLNYNDIIQIDFRDSYYNNTIKTMMSFRWVNQHCPIADYYLFSDDDMYISTSNLLNYVQDRKYSNNLSSSDRVEIMRGEKDSSLFAGYVFSSAPHRYRTSKWWVSLQEYPWNRWPSYVTAGAYVVSNKAMRTLYVGSLFVKHFRFDDIYLGIVAKKVGIPPTHCPEFYFYKKSYTKDGYRNVIASHGYADHAELLRVWKEQNVHS